MGDTEVSATLGSSSASADLEVTAATITTVSVTPSAFTLADGTQASARAFAAFSDGTQQEVTETAQWSTSDGSIATVDATGRITAVDPGVATLTALFGGQSGQSTVEVTTAVPTALSLRPQSPSVALGLTQQFQAFVTLSDASEQNVTDQVLWTSSDTATAAVDNQGLAVSRAVGEAQIRAALGTLEAETSFTVREATLTNLTVESNQNSLAEGTQLQLQAFASYTDGSRSEVTSQASWMSSSSAVASVDGNGLATGLGVGEAAVSATFAGQTAQKSVTVTDAVLQTLVVTPNEKSLAKGLTQQYIATGHFSNGDEQDLSGEVIWSADPTNIADIDPSGLLTGREIGSATVKATRGTVSGTTSVTVSEATLVNLTFGGEENTLADGTRLQMQVFANYTDGSRSDVTGQASWVSSVSTVAAVDQQGLITGLEVGETTVSASFGSQSVGKTVPSQMPFYKASW